MSYPKLKRNRYADENRFAPEHSGLHHAEDMQDFHLPLAQVQNAGLYTWGVVQGLEVSGTVGGDIVTVQPGIAIDSQGRTIVLPSSGFGDIGADPPNGQHQETPTPVNLSLSNHTGLVYLLLQYSERLRDTEGSYGRLEQVPWLRLQSAATFVDDGAAVILAVVRVDDDHHLLQISHDGMLVGAGKPGRKVIGQALHTVAFHRSLSRRAPNDSGVEVQTVTNGATGQISAIDEGGLRITVPTAQDKITLSGEQDHPFADLTLHASQTNITGELQVKGKVSVTGPSSFSENVDLNATTTSANLHVTGDLQADSNLRLAGNLGIGTGLAPARAKLDVNGDLRLQNGSAVNEFSSDVTLADSSRVAVPTEHAVKEYIDNLLIGSIAAFATDTPPAGWLECNGFALPREGIYAKLFARISTRFGHGNGSTTFNIPDLRGQFIRGWDHGAGNDPDRNSRYRRVAGGAAGDAVGSYQGYAMPRHNHVFSGSTQATDNRLGNHWHPNDDRFSWQSSQPSSGGWVRTMSGYRWTIKGAEFTWTPDWFWLTPLDDAWTGPADLKHAHLYTPAGSISVTGESETRPINASLMFCIKY